MAVKSLWVIAIAAIVLAPLHTKNPSIQTFSDSGIPTSHPFSPLVLVRAEGGVGEALELITNRILGQARSRAKRLGAMATKALTGWGDAVEVIIETVRREKIDVVVIGRRGRGRLTGLLLGSVSQKLASLAPCMVMIVP